MSELWSKEDEDRWTQDSLRRERNKEQVGLVAAASALRKLADDMEACALNSEPGPSH